MVYQKKLIFIASIPLLAFLATKVFGVEAGGYEIALLMGAAALGMLAAITPPGEQTKATDRQ
ncbi:MAG: hypothetical protein GW858_10790 [Sphingomonadales bacterium]|nr:hypothetical protein [Sphingomonadales bacterium]NCQ22195.1 hypothetical protein [Sphingomonadales bacterium]NCT03553.1 hypothetical protein [Sphingomonadales bacterium]